MKKLGIIAIVALVALMGVAPDAAQAQSAKSTARVGQIQVLDAAMQAAQASPWSAIMRSTLRTSQQKNVYIDVSLEVGLRTRTLVKGKGGSKDSAMADAGVKVRVLIDGVEAYPGEVVFSQRKQELSAVFGGVLESCTDADDDGTIMLDECVLSDEEIELVLETMAAHSFNFVSDSLDSGEHMIEIQAQISNYAEAGAGEAEAKAVLGKGSVTVEEVRLVKDDEIQL